MTPAPATSVLIVCRANVCRSPLAAWELERALAGAGVADDYEVVSRGTHASGATPPCPRIADGRGLTGRSTQLEDDDVLRATLIVTADRECRADIVRRSPGAAGRTFTIREAAALVDGIVGVGDEVTWSGPDSLVRALHAARGLVPTFGDHAITLPRSGLRRRSVKVHLQDVPDAHSEVSGMHGVIEQLTPPAMTVIAGALTRAAASLS